MLFLSLFFFYLVSEPEITFSPPFLSITFRTEEAMRTELFYGKEGLASETLKEKKANKEHKFLLTDLTSGVRYEFQIKVGNYLSPKYYFTYPSEEMFRIILLPPGRKLDKPLRKFLSDLLPELLIAESQFSIQKGEKRILIPIIEFPRDTFIKSLQINPRESIPFSLFFLPYKKDSVAFYYPFPILEMVGELDIVFLTGGNSFIRTYPMGKNPYDLRRPGLVYSDNGVDCSQERKGVIYFILPDGRNPFSLSFPKAGNQYIAFAQSGKGFVELLKENKRLKVRTYIFDDNLMNYQVVDSFIIDRERRGEALKISKVRVKEVNSFSAQIGWETNLSAVSLIEWGIEPNRYLFRQPPLDIQQVFSIEHTSYLFGLLPNKRYYYRVGARRGDKIIWSEENSFVTLSADRKEILLAVNFTHPAYKTDFNFFPVSPYTYPKRDNGAQFIGLWDREMVFTILSEESLSVRATQHWVRNSQIAKWSFPIPSGRYYYEIGSFSAPQFSGPTKIKIEGKTLQKEEGDTIFFGEIEVSDEELNLELGYEDSLIPGYSGISYLIISSRPREKRDETIFLLSATPNPFRDKTVLKYHLARSRRVILEVYDGMGKKLFTLKNRFEGRGYQECVWDGKDLNGFPLPPGIYFIGIRTEDEPGWKVKVSLLRD